MHAKLTGMPAIFAFMLALVAAAPPTTTVPMHLVNNHVVVEVALNGAGPFRFIVDSGAGNLVDPAVADAIGLRVGGRVQLRGVGGTLETGGVTTIRNVRIGGADFADQRFVVAGTRATFSSAEGPAVDGLIGRGIIGTGITVFDYAGRSVTFGAGTDAIVNGGTTVLPLTTTDGLPQVPCKIARVAGSCTIDTGSRLPVSVLGPFAQRNPAVVPQSVSAVGVDGYGIGGPAYGKLGLLSSLSFGEITLVNVVADFSTQQRGVFADERTAANVGGGVLRRFTLAIDLANHRIGLRPNADFDAPPEIDRAGLFLIVRDNAIAVLDVRPGTPATRAGVARDDVILAVNGRPYTPDMLPALRAIFEGQPDTLVQLLVARGAGVERKIALRLADYL